MTGYHWYWYLCIVICVGAKNGLNITMLFTHHMHYSVSPTFHNESIVLKSVGEGNYMS